MLGSPTTQTLISPRRCVPSLVTLCTPPNSINRIPRFTSSLPANTKIDNNEKQTNTHTQVNSPYQLSQNRRHAILYHCSMGYRSWKTWHPWTWRLVFCDRYLQYRNKLQYKTKFGFKFWQENQFWFRMLTNYLDSVGVRKSYYHSAGWNVVCRETLTFGDKLEFNSILT